MSESKIGRRSFLKLATLGAASSTLFGASNQTLSQLPANAPDPYPGSKKCAQYVRFVVRVVA